MRFVIIGAGISGLACAYFLKRGGHDVVVVEKSEEKGRCWNGGLRVPPNMTRLLQELPGSTELLEGKGTPCTGFLKSFSFQETTYSRDLADNHASQITGKMEFHEVIDDLGGQFYMIPHRDLHNYLLSLCTDEGVTVKYSFEVKDIITIRDKGATVISENNDHLTTDMIGKMDLVFMELTLTQVVGADGKNSIARSILLAEEFEETEHDSEESSFIASEQNIQQIPDLNEFTGATISLPIDLMKTDPELLSLLEDNHYGPNLYTIDLTYGKPAGPDNIDENWQSESPVKSILNHLVGYEPRYICYGEHQGIEFLEKYNLTAHPFRVQKVFRLVSSCHCSIQKIHKLPRYVSKHEQIALIGDAAHAIVINGTHNTSCGFEDAVTLSRLFTKENLFPSKNRSLLLSGFNHITHQRATMCEAWSIDSVSTLGAPPGPVRDGRNNFLKLTLDSNGESDETSEQIWASYVAQFDYDARDAVDEWWLNWAKPNIDT
ncbi:hypothetical protein GYMLUDRAFT_60441 [Collybiopsis luxurians FD-317 M1]|uniref:FAD dependent oxidoreductase domain-containing protein n=1 Tax=Collybiopsis luxurians FD-317 M1 TaxID=944289 RepID=A0A0D0CT97_9AGAR|nr:hypothetical protein GYMLUDRAFT_60441 [Collybiopsis luxurians FD-317 M1]